MLKFVRIIITLTKKKKIVFYKMYLEKYKRKLT